PADLTLIKEIINTTDNIPDTNSTKNVFKLKYANAKDVENVLNVIFFNKKQVADGKGKPVENTSIQVGSSITSDRASNSIIVSGDREFYTQVQELIKSLDIERDQVYVETLILEATLEKASNF
ncbi:MAG: type II secretion system protein GspD, partial [Nitrospirae bacterium]|nr:type II secretion system protein GspD [Nitrospirota bacterium]